MRTRGHGAPAAARMLVAAAALAVAIPGAASDPGAAGEWLRLDAATADGRRLRYRLAASDQPPS